MKNLALIGVALMTLATTNAQDGDKDRKTPDTIYDITVKNIDGTPVKLSQFKGDVLMIVNVASKCGLTDNHYKRLQPLYEEYKDQGFKILAFPANNFGSQEPGTNDDIKEFCTKKYDVTFDLFEKVSVKGDDQCELYRFLTEHKDKEIAGDVVWNFQKYLVDRQGNVIAKLHPRTNPDDREVTHKIEKALEEKN
jgi:glutathione peroxidase